MVNMFIDKNTCYDKNELAVRLILSALPHNIDNIIFTSIDEIAYYMTGKLINSQQDRRIISAIKDGLISLIDRGIIVCIENNKNNYIIDGSSCVIDTKKNFIILEQWEVHKIFSYGTSEFDLLLYYVNIIGTINGDSKTWHMSQDNMVEYWNMNKATINKYNDILQELKLLYIYKSNRRKKDGTFNRVNNVYGRYRDAAKIIADGNLYASTIETYKEIQSIDRTSIKLKYNSYVKGAKKYIDDNSLVKELYCQCELYNESLNGDRANENLNPLDLSVFNGLIEDKPLNIQEDKVPCDKVWGEYIDINPFGLFDEEIDDIFNTKIS